MFPLLEAIRIENGQFYNIEAHQQRLNEARKVLWQCQDTLVLKEQLLIPDHLTPEKRYKCRVVYDTHIREVTYEAYTIRPIRSLRILEAKNLDYRYKLLDRSALKILYEQRGNCDDILITRNGYLTDTYYCNLACWNGNQWLTPAQPLLKGTHRAKLLKEGRLTEANIHKETLRQFERIVLFNAMIDLEDELVVPLNQVID